MHRRQLLTIGMAGLVGSAWAQQDRPLRVLVALGNRSVVVENKPGAATKEASS